MSSGPSASLASSVVSNIAASAPRQINYTNTDNDYIYEWPYYDDDDISTAKIMYPATQWQNVAVLSLVFIFALVANLSALPVILFRRTKFGNGLFAVLILCLTISDLAVTFFSVLGSLIVEASHFLWGGAPGSCQVYHWLSAWLSGLSAYLLVAIIGMVMVKTTTSCLQRLRDCRWLLLALLVMSALLAMPELFIRATVDLGFGGLEQDFCLLGVDGLEYFLYVSFRLLLRHLLPALLVLAAIVRPETQLSKRVSHLFFGHLTAPCMCGDGGSALGLPHECPTMQTAMLRSQESENSSTVGTNGKKVNGGCTGGETDECTAENGHLHRPDVVVDSEPVGFVKNGKVHKLMIQPEDPHRRRYKRFLAGYFLVVSVLNLVLDLTFQIQSSRAELTLEETLLLSEPVTSEALTVEYESVSEVEYANHASNLVTALYVIGHLQQIGDPIIFLIAEFGFK